MIIQSIPQSKLTINTGVQLQIAFLGNENGNVVDIPVRAYVAVSHVTCAGAA